MDGGGWREMDGYLDSCRWKDRGGKNDPIWHARKLAGKEIDIGKKALRIK